MYNKIKMFIVVISILVTPSSSATSWSIISKGEFSIYTPPIECLLIKDIPTIYANNQAIEGAKLIDLASEGYNSEVIGVLDYHLEERVGWSSVKVSYAPYTDYYTSDINVKVYFALDEREHYELLDYSSKDTKDLRVIYFDGANWLKLDSSKYRIVSTLPREVEAVYSSSDFSASSNFIEIDSLGYFPYVIIYDEKAVENYDIKVIAVDKDDSTKKLDKTAIYLGDKYIGVTSSDGSLSHTLTVTTGSLTYGFKAERENYYSSGEKIVEVSDLDISTITTIEIPLEAIPPATNFKGGTSIDTYNSIDVSKSLVMNNQFIKVGVSEDGTFGVGGGNSPGMLYDKTGTSNYINEYDYLTPGVPYEFWSLKYNYEDNYVSMNNTGYNNNERYVTDSVIEVSKTFSDGNISEIIHTAVIDGKLSVKHIYTLLDKQEFIAIKTTIKNISEETITNVLYARGLDPDSDSISHSTTITNNTRGYNSGTTVLAPENIAFSTGSVSGYPIGIGTLSTIAHNSFISSDSWKSDPTIIIEGSDGNSSGDENIAIGFNLGDLLPSKEITFNYFYLFTDNLTTSIESILEEKSESLEITKFIESLESGWHNVGFDKDIEDISSFNSAKIVWKYSLGMWSAYSFESYKSLIKEKSIPEITEVAPNRAIWILK